MPKAIRTFSNDQQLVEVRRKHIVNCAIDLFMKKGFEESTTADIAVACGRSKGLLYHYVSSKDDILYLIANDQAEGTTRGFSHLSDRCRELNPVEAVIEYIDYYYGVVNTTQSYQVFLNQLHGGRRWPQAIFGPWVSGAASSAGRTRLISRLSVSTI